MARRLVISDGTTAREISTYKVAVGGVVKSITIASVADSDVVRQYYPYGVSVDEPDPGILWTTTAATITEQAIDPNDSSASILFSRDLGTYTYSNYPDADVTGQYLSPPVSGANEYIIKVDQVSGDAITGTLASWVDFNSAATHTWSLEQTTEGSSTGVADISISQDNGVGAPVADTTVVKRCTFISEVVVSSYIAWGSQQRDLVEIKEAENADCVLLFSPEGWASGAADTSGSFSDKWHFDSPNASNPENFTVNVTKVSGTSPTGSALGSDLALSTVRQWTLATASEDEDLSCALDVTVSDGINSSTKRVTMNSQRADVIVPPDWDTTPWSCTDAGYPQGLALLGSVYLDFNADGTATIKMETTELPLTTFHTGTWITPAPVDLNDYEVRLTNLNTGITSGQTEDVWYRMSQAFEVEWATLPSSRTRTFDAEVRAVGGIATVKTISVTMIGASDDQPL